MHFFTQTGGVYTPGELYYDYKKQKELQKIFRDKKVKCGKKMREITTELLAIIQFGEPRS